MDEAIAKLASQFTAEERAILAELIISQTWSSSGPSAGHVEIDRSTFYAWGG